MKKIIKFCVHQLIVGEQEFSLEPFNEIKNQDLDVQKLFHSDTGELEITSINKVVKTISQDRFVFFYFHQGDKFPYPPKVIKPDLSEEDNPRAAENIELREQFFSLIDVKSQKMYLSDQKKKTFFKKWLKLETKKAIDTKSIISEEDFIDKIKTISSISFSVKPNLLTLTQNGVITEHLSQDIFGFDAEKAKLEFIYGNSRISDKIKDKIKSLVGKKYDFQDLVVVGRNDDNFERILNAEEVISKILIDVEVDEKTEFFNPDIVLAALIEKIIIEE